MDFSDWLISQMNRQGWSQSDLARASGLNRQSISDYVNKRRTNPDANALNSIARALKLPPEEVYRAAGLLPGQPKSNPSVEEILHIARQLPQTDLDDLIALARTKLERHERIKKSAR